jgi:hypothetical protein
MTLALSAFMQTTGAGRAGAGLGGARFIFFAKAFVRSESSALDLSILPTLFVFLLTGGDAATFNPRRALRLFLTESETFPGAAAAEDDSEVLP